MAAYALGMQAASMRATEACESTTGRECSIPYVRPLLTLPSRCAHHTMLSEECVGVIDLPHVVSVRHMLMGW